MDHQDRETLYSKLQANFGDQFQYWYHAYSEALFLDASSFLKDGDIAIDAGCYVGDNALKMAEYVGETGVVFTFEPDPRLRPKAVAHFKAAPQGDRIILKDVALSDKAGTSDFVIVEELEGHSGLRKKKYYGREISTWTVPVSVVRLDDFLADVAVDHSRVKLIKFDLEGGELDACLGATQAITRGRPLILFEYGNYDTYDHMPSDYIEFFADRDYRIIDAFGFPLLSTDVLVQTIGWNLFAVPDGNAEQFICALIHPRLDALD
jgi:FkbM family methyltransferase